MGAAPILHGVTVRDLGTLRVVHGDEERPCAGPKQAALLATLAMHANQRVPLDDLVIGAWGYDATVSSSTVENHVWRLRRLLDPAYSRSSASPLVNDSGGYRLVLPAEGLDSAAFADLAEQARRALAEGRAAEALDACDSALALWRGEPYEVVGHVPATAAASARLEEIRGQVVELRIDALIGAGRREQALADLEVLTGEFPYRERLWAQRMSALAAVGRTEEALDTFQRVRSMLRDELGLEPGRELQRVQHGILAADPHDEAPRAVSPPSPKVGHVHLPRRRVELVGRDQEVARLHTVLEEESLVTVVGTGGSGKTRLVVEVARTLGDWFADGIWFADLTAVTDPALVADAVASTIGLVVEGSEVLDALRAYVRERRILLVLDNCEHVLDGAAQVAEAMLTETGSVLLVTSRQPLTVDGERVVELAPLAVREVGEEQVTTARSPAAELFASRLGRDVGDEELEVVEGICRAVDGLPLAIELAAARAQVFSLVELLAQVEQDPSRLGRIGRGHSDHRTSLWSAIEWSHRLLETSEQAIHRRLASLPGPFTLPAASAVAQGPDLDVQDIPDGLARLVHRSLLVSARPRTPGRPTVFRQLDTVRAHARVRLDETSETAATMARRDGWATQLVLNRPRLGEMASKGYFDNLEDAYPALRATMGAAVTSRPDPEMLLAGSTMLYFWYYRHRLAEGRRWMQAVADSARWGRDPGVPPPEVVAFRLGLAGLQLLNGDVALARHQLDLALPHVADCPDHLVTHVAEVLSGACNCAWGRNEYDAAQQLSEVLGELVRGSSDPRLRVLVDQAVCVSRIADRDPAETALLAEDLYAEARTHGNLIATWSACGARMIVATMDNDPEAGIAWVDRLIPVHATFGSGGGGAFLESLANFASLSDDPQLAVRMYAAGYAETRRVGMVWPIQLNTEELIARVRSQLTTAEYDRLWAEGEQLTYEQVARDRGLAPIA